MQAESAPAPEETSPPSPPPPPPKVEKPGLGFDHSATSDFGGPFERAKVYVDGKQEIADKNLPEWHTDRAIEFIEKAKDKPFALFLFMPGPPEPLNYAPGKEQLYPPASLPLPPEEASDPKNTPSRVRNASILQKCPKPAEALRQAQSKYYSFVSQLDDNVGRILKALDDAGLDDNTLIVFTADQGFATGQNGAWGSGPVFWEEVIRCPLWFRLPKPASRSASRPSGTQADGARSRPGGGSTPPRINRVVSLVDLAPTLLEIAGLPVSPTMGGRSLLPLIRDGRDRYRGEEAFVEYEEDNKQPFPARVLVIDQYKLVDYLQDADQFYDLKRDPGEERNLVDEPAYSGPVKAMRARLEQWRKRTRDTMTRR